MLYQRQSAWRNRTRSADRSLRKRRMRGIRLAPVYVCPHLENAQSEATWSSPRAWINHFPWAQTGDGYRPVAWAQCFWSEDALHVRLFCEEEAPKITYFNPNEPVYEDSCLEFFIMLENSDCFYNFELNASGTLLVGRTHDGKLVHIPASSQAPFKAMSCHTTGGWGVQIRVPFSLFGLPHASEWQAKPVFRCNFYKCGEATIAPHYGCWSAVEHPYPLFHLPNFFGRLLLADSLL